MLSQEALFFGIREGLKLGALYMLWSCVHTRVKAGADYRSLNAAAATAVLVFFFMSLAGAGMQTREIILGLSGYAFFLVFFSASIVLLMFPDVETLPYKGRLSALAHALVFSISFLFLAPDAVSASIYIKDLGSLQNGASSVYSSLLMGALPVFAVMLLLSRRLSPRAGRYLGLPQVLILLVLIKLLLSGIPGVSGFSLVPTVQRGVMKFVHDLIHQSFLFLLVPDHPMLQTTVWNFIGFFFGPDFSITLALCILLAPPLYYLYRSLTAQIKYPAESVTGADRRLLRAQERKERGRRAFPIVIFVIMVALGWYWSGSEKAVSLYVPEPTPLIEDKGLVMVPLSSPGMDLMDGRIHKFSVLVDGKGVSLLVVRKPDGTLAVTLDACEICPPRGYGQRGGQVVCIYCMTPIPLDTLGRPGGCNPIPLASTATDRDVTISMDEIRAKWNALVVSQGKGGR